MAKQYMVGLLCLSLMGSCFLIKCEASEPVDNFDNNEKQTVQNNYSYITSIENFDEAYNAYISARTADENINVNEEYAIAIDRISKVVTIDRDNADAWLLGAQIYCARGGLSYAKNYFSHAIAAYEKRLIENINNPKVKLKYAIACYASDARYLSNYNDYTLSAYIAASESLKLIAVEEEKNVLPSYDLDKLVAHIILHDDKVEDCLQVLKKRHDKKSLEYKLASDVYEGMVKQGKWFWTVNSRESAEKEFLLYYLFNE